ncbi:MAG: SUMF1/EgtB/PvdO family nonheme iron enzyme [Sedimentisphaerales bacterium]|nr:SUMF1/EgtB/PvdO family nonheme iron enzyme [Sedimentisphaerales bacterium]
MRYSFLILAASILLHSIPCPAEPVPDGFVLIQDGTCRRGTGARQTGARCRVEDFEILDHPVTNAEYKTFVDAAGYHAPLHWAGGRIPRGKEDYPVIFVNRMDVDAYLRWLTGETGRICRLPTSVEFEYAARGDLAGKLYPWGDEAPAGRANYDAAGDRRFDRWQDSLRPARWGAKNGYGLYGMAGNLWQLTADHHDPATSRWKYRIVDPVENERTVMGGSWARGESYLKCGVRLGVSAGIRHPDVGFRPVREPRGADWRVQHRKLCVTSAGDGKALLSWALLASDRRATRFNVYRAGERNHAGFCVNEEPVAGSTTFLDAGLSAGRRYQYYVRPVDAAGRQGRRCEWAGVTVADEASAILVTFAPLFKQGALVPIFGDLNGDGTLDCVIRMDNGNREMSQDPGLPVQLEAFTSYGRSLWRKDICTHDHCFGSANNVPFNVWDMDADGKAEVVTRLQIAGEVYVAILDGMTGAVKCKAKWPDMVSDFAKSSTRIHLSVAYLDGKHPAVITQTGLYENEVFAAYDREMRELWRFHSFAETNGSGGHKIEVADVDGDGRQEAFDGTTCLNHDGTVRWSIYRQHPDIVSIHDYLPERPGLEVFYIVESSVHAGVYMVDADSGEVIWKVNREDDPRWTHGHTGWTADIWAGSPGIECVSNRAGHGDRNLILFSADGHALLEPFPYGYTPLEWDGDVTRELLAGRVLGDFDGETIVPRRAGPLTLPDNSSVLMVADLYGDFRDELILSTASAEGDRTISVMTAAEPVSCRYVTATESLDYRLWMGRNMGGGYRSIYDRPLVEAPD